MTVNGIGERAGNTSLEEVVMALKTRPAEFNVFSAIDATQITRASRMVSTFTGMFVQPNKAIVGANAFAHEAGIHQDGVLKHADTYEIMKPESVGLTTNNLVLGKHSGKHAYKMRLEALGFTDLTEDQIDEFVDKFKRLADEKKSVSDADIEAIVHDEIYQPELTWSLMACHVTSGSQVRATATVTLEHVDGYEITEARIGSGPVDAIYQAIDSIVKVPNKLCDFSIRSITSGINAVGEVTTKLQTKDEEADQGEDLSRKLIRSDSGVDFTEFKNPQTGAVTLRTFVGNGVDSDILVASAKSYVSALNCLVAHQSLEENARVRMASSSS